MTPKPTKTAPNTKEQHLTGTTNAESAKPRDNTEANKKGKDSTIKTYKQGIGIPTQEDKVGQSEQASDIIPPNIQQTQGREVTVTKHSTPPLTSTK